jgi:hypothetical protein
VEGGDAGARQGALGRHVAKAGGKHRDDRRLAGVAGGEADVPALAGQRLPASPAGISPDTPRPVPAPSSARGAFGWGAAADLLDVGAEARQGQRQGGEIVDEDEPLEPQRQPQRLDGEGPGVVGHAHRVARERGGDAEGRHGRQREVLGGEVMADGRVEPGKA